jgi:NADH:ubiquinone oxidoreductase subunit C
MDADTLIAAVRIAEPDAEARDDVNKPSVRVPLARLLPLLERLRSDEELSFDFLLAHTAVDWIEESRFELMYVLYSTVHGHYLVVSCDLPRVNPVAPTASRIWPIAEWQEREVYDLFGIQYDEHPDLRRLFLEDDWKGFPLRKDYKDEDMLERLQ